MIHFDLECTPEINDCYMNKNGDKGISYRGKINTTIKR